MRERVKEEERKGSSEGGREGGSEGVKGRSNPAQWSHG